MALWYVDPAASGTNAGTSWTNAWTSLSSPMTSAAAGDTIYCRGKQSRTTAEGAIATTKNGTVNSRLKFVGCNAAGVANAGQFTLLGTAGNLPTNLLSFGHSYYNFENFTFDAASSNLVIRATGGYWTFKRCIFQNGSAAGFYNTYYYCMFEYCVFQNNVIGVQESWSTVYRYCKFIHNSQYGLFSSRSTNVYIDCLVHANGISGITFGANSENNQFINSTFDGHTASTGIGLDASNARDDSIIVKCRFTNNKIGLKANTTLFVYENDNFFYNNSTAHKQNTNNYCGAEDVTGTADGYVDATNNNFSLLDAAQGKNVPIDLDWNS